MGNYAGSRLRLLAVTTALVSAFVGGLHATPSAAQGRAVNFQIPPQSLQSALLDYSRATNRQIIFSADDLRGLQSNGLRGGHEPSKALDLLLADTGLTWRRSPSGSIEVRRSDEASPQPQAAAGAAGIEPPATLEAVVVTGTRIAGIAPVGARPVVLSRDDIEASGRGTAADLLRLLPQNTNLGVGDEVRRGAQSGAGNASFATAVNLRGLGTDATLTLVNGRRLASSSEGGVVDTSQIPLLALERVEVVTDGASAIYGSDAVAGVVNFLLRRDFDGAESLVRYGGGDGFDQLTLGQAVGRTWRGGGVFAAVDYFEQSALAATKRSFYTSDLRPFGGPDLRTINGIPGTLVVGGVNYALPDVAPGTITPAQLVAGTANRRELWADAEIIPATERVAGVLNFHHQITPQLRVFFDALASRRESTRREANLQQTLTVPRSNPFFISPNPAAQSVSVAYNYATLFGGIDVQALAEDVSLHGGFELDLGRDWSATLAGLSSRNRTDSRNDDLRNSSAVTAALADPNPATALNPFGGFGANSASVIERVRGWSEQNRRLSLNSVSVEAAGPLFELPGGALRLALGAETRKERLHGHDLSFTTNAAPTPGAPIRFGRRVDAVFVEALFPLVSDRNAVAIAHSLVVSAAIRGEHYSDVGETWNPKLGVEWRPWSELTISGTWSTSFKAPRLPQLQTSSNTVFTQTLSLPSGPVTLLTIGGNDPNLRPETAETWTASVNYQPEWVPGLRLSVSYFDIDYRDRIIRPTTAELVAALTSPTPTPIVIARPPSEAQVLALYADPKFISGQKPPPSTIFAITNGQSANIGGLRQSGFDVQVSYAAEVAGGDIALDAVVTHLTRYEITRVRGGATFDALDTTNAPVDTRARLSARWSRGAWGAVAALDYVDSYTNTTITPNQRVKAWLTADAQLSYAPEVPRGPLSGLRAALDVRNVFDTNPPRVAHVTASVGYDPEQASALGRVVALTLTKSW